MKILIISKEVWRNDQNGGNTLTWMFSRFPKDTEFANVFCSEGVPQNDICRRYFKLTSKMVARTILSRYNKGIGEIFYYDDIANESIINAGSRHEASRKTSLLSNLFNSEWLRDIVWGIGQYRSGVLRQYIQDFNPDIIYAPGYGVKYMNYLLQWIMTFVSCPVVSLISDDFYSMHQIRLSPAYWLEHAFFRACFRKTASKYSLIYTMTDAQRSILERDFNKPVKIFHKGAEIPKTLKHKGLHAPIKLIYAGNLYFNRWKTLEQIAKAIKIINEKQISQETSTGSFLLEIYTNSAINNKIKKRLNVDNACKLHDAVSSDELALKYNESDIALHVEAFDLVNKEKVRLSFSTKITDCIASGCAVMSVCDKDQGGNVYLNKHNAAICINRVCDIKPVLESILTKPAILEEYRRRAYELGVANHTAEYISQNVYNDFSDLITT